MAATGWRASWAPSRRLIGVCTTQGRPRQPRSSCPEARMAPVLSSRAQQRGNLGAGGPRIALFRVSGRWRGQRLCNHGGGAARGGGMVAMGAGGRPSASYSSGIGHGAGSSGPGPQPERQQPCTAARSGRRCGTGGPAARRRPTTKLKLVAGHGAMQAPAQGGRRRPPGGGCSPELAGCWFGPLLLQCIRAFILKLCRCPAAAPAAAVRPDFRPQEECGGCGLREARQGRAPPQR